MNLSGMSALALEDLAAKAKSLASDLRKEEPTYALALEAGVVANGYNTVRWGFVPSYHGTAIITMANGKKWKAIGHGPSGSAEYVSRDGHIEFVPVEWEPPCGAGEAHYNGACSCHGY